MKQLLTLLTLLFLTLTSQTFACDCENQGHFLTVATKSKLVALVKVRAYSTFENINDASTPTSMQVEIVEIFSVRKLERPLPFGETTVIYVGLI